MISVRGVMRASVVAAMMLWASSARADWDMGDLSKMHYPQLPDLSTNGVDVDMSQNWLADDFRCTRSGPITDFHLWGSWKDDAIGNPGNVAFTVKVYSDLPAAANPILGYSMPQTELWSKTFGKDEFSWRLWAKDLNEEYWDPITGIHSPDTKCYQYNFTVPETEALTQTEGAIYWLAVMAVPLEAYTQIGWKSSPDHFQDAAVFWDWGQTSPIWVNLAYPSWHPMATSLPSMDLAFVITPEPATLSLLALGGLLALRRRR